MFRRRILDFAASPPIRPLLTPVLYYSRPSLSCSASTASAPRCCESVLFSSATVQPRRFYRYPQHPHKAAAPFHASTLLHAPKAAPPTGSGISSKHAAPLLTRESNGQPAMSQDGVEVPCSAQLTIGDVTIPVPDFAVHPERVAWAPPGIDHTAPFLHKAPVHGGASLPAPDALPSLQGDAMGEENMFFSVQDPLTRSYLRWIAQKEQLGQDMCLIGDPGPAMRWLVMLYSHLTRREIRVVYLNSDITESDLKQRREIRNGSLIYDDQSAVSAAVEGQLLVLEGLERVERNVLPVVNNLLENREMHLDNGSVLIHPARYDSLLQKLYESKLNARIGHGRASQAGTALRVELIAEAKHELAQMGLVRVSEKFRVIGITVPVPPYEGNPLDPPLRSRFQCLYVRTPLPVVAPSSSVVNALGDASGAHANRKRSKQVAELQERQSVRFAEVAQLRAAITAINDSTRDFQLSKPSKKKKKPPQTADVRSRQGMRYGNVYNSSDVVEEMFRDEGGADDADADAKSDGSNSSAAAAAASSPLQTVGHWALATIAQQLALFPDLPVGEAVMRGFPWPYYARQLTRSGAGGAATGYANVEEYHRRLGQYAEVLQHCHVYPPLLMAADLSHGTPTHAAGARRGGLRSSPEPATRSARVGARLRSVVQGEGVEAGSDEAAGAATARAYIRSAQLVSASASSPSATASVPEAVQQACNYVLRLRRLATTAVFSGVPVVVAEAVVATAAHDAEHPGEAGTYALPIFLGAGALPQQDGTHAAASAPAPAWERDVADYLTTTAAPATVFTTEHFHVLQSMLHVHASRQHMCLLGPTGCGKTAMVRAFGHLLGYEEMLTMHLYADMTNKDLFQQRMTDPKTGNTTWQDSPLLHAAIYGKLVVLDGMEKLPSGMLSSLQQLLVDQCAVLADGTILKPPTEYALLKEKMGLTDAGMRERKIFPVHPAFRAVATARPPMPVSGGGGGGSGGGVRGGKDFFITHDLTTLFRVVAMPDAGEDALGPVLRQVAEAEISVVQGETWRGSTESTAEMRERSQAVVGQLMQLRGELETLHAADGKMPQLSLRQLRQLVRSAVRYPSRVEESVRNTLLLPLMTGVAATKVRHALESCGLAEPEAEAAATTTSARSNNTRYPYGGGGAGAARAIPQQQQQHRRRDADFEVLSQQPTLVPFTAADGAPASATAASRRVWKVNGEPVLQLSRAYTQSELALVPFVTGFHANRVHESILAWLAKQYAMRSNILLIGNQGVGKNKVVDAFLSRLAIPRHYIQLHRDTTVGSLTINPTVEAGKVIWEDSPLVKAVQQGHCLVVDEIDKAPVEVVQVLKGLIEDREMRLGDGRLIYDPARQHAHPAAAAGDVVVVSAATERIPIHPDFRIIVLANPPGFPFHGNDFFRECGDLFAAYVMGNPDAESQLRVLTAYAPTLPRPLLERLVAVFIELQGAFTQGNLTYPFSLRELIAVVKHMSRYPQDGIFGALNNVFNFDARDDNTLRLVRQVLAHYLQPMIQQGGLQRLRPYGAGQAVPLTPFKSLLTLPTKVTPTADSSSNAGQFQALVEVSADVVADPSALLATVAGMRKGAAPTSQLPRSWCATYPTSAFFPEEGSSNELAKSFTEWVSQCVLPFKNPTTDTVLSVTAYNALGGDDVVDDAAAAVVALPLLSVVLLRDSSIPHGSNGRAEGISSDPLERRRQVLVATVRLPPSPLDTRHLVADAAEELTTLWPVGQTRFVDVTEHFTGELSASEGSARSMAQLNVAALRLPAHQLPWRVEVSDSQSADGSAMEGRHAAASQSATAVCTWPPSLATCGPSQSRQMARNSVFQHTSGADAARERTPQAILLLSSPTTGSAVLIDAFAGAITSELYLHRMGLDKPSTTPAAASASVADAPQKHELTEADVSTASVVDVGPVLPLHLNQLIATYATSETSTAAAAVATAARVLDVRASQATVAFASIEPSTQCCFLIRGHVVKATLPHPVKTLRFVGDHLAMVELLPPRQRTPSSAPGAAAETWKGVLKVTLTADGSARAAFLPLPADAQHLELVEATAVHGGASTDLTAVTATQLTPDDLAASVWRVVGAAASPAQQPRSQTAVGAAPNSADGTVAEAAAEAEDDPAAPNVVYARVEGTSAAGLQLRYYKNTSTTSAVKTLASSSPIVADSARHQLLQMDAGKQSVVAVDTVHGTLRTFAGQASIPTSTLENTAVVPLTVDSGSGTAYTWDSQSQQLSVADVDAERVRQRYAEWSSLLSGNAATVGDAATVEEGEEEVKDFKMKYSTPRKQPSGTLKHGEVDDQEHHGGNTWAGGTGGTDTAGLGGMIGPYRLDKGNPVHQVSPEEKRKVPKHLIEEARRMGREALKERLQSIGMTEAEYEEYQRLQERVRPAVAQLRTLLMGLKAAEGERVWVTGQTDGVWDDKKLVEGIVGEKNVYKRRVDSKETNPFQQKYKKRLVFVLDVSASMYRFNGMDQRLTKLLETTVMVMEAFAGFESKLDYAMIGHNGDSDNIPLVNFGAPPANQKERMVICQKMVAYAQYCWSGDNTVEAMQRSVELVTKEKGDSYFVFVVSDANLQQYGITPRQLTDIIQSKPEVKMFCIFIATLGAQASRLQQQLPAGHGFECMRTDMLPQVMRHIFVSANLF